MEADIENVAVYAAFTTYANGVINFLIGSSSVVVQLAYLLYNQYK